MPIDLPTGTTPLTLVYTRENWADSWTEQSLLECLSIQSNVAPSHSSAVLRQRYGVCLMPEIGARPEDSTPATVTRPDILGHYVKVVITGVADWYGIIPDSSDNRIGVQAGIEQGEVTFTAFGLTWLLENSKPIRQTKIKTGTGTSAMINRAIPFNGGTGDAPKERRSRWRNYDSTEKCFTDYYRTASPLAWKAKHAVEYLIDNFTPKDKTGADLVPFVLDTDALTFLDYELPQIEYHGRTIWDLLNQMIARYRGLGFHAWVDTVPDPMEVKLKVWSQNAALITLPGGSTVPANPDTASYNFDTAKNILDATVGTTLMTQYDQVYVEGDRAGSVFTVRPDTYMLAAWPEIDEEEYSDGASAQTGYSGLSTEDKEAADNDFRAQDAYSKVFSHWVIDPAWNGRADTDPSSGTHDFAFPELDADGADDPLTSATFQGRGLRIMPYVPFLPGVDYTTGVDTDTNSVYADAADFLPPIVLFKLDAVNTSHTADNGWVHAERINEASGAGSTKRPYQFSVDISVMEDAPGLIFRVVGSPQHYIGLDGHLHAHTYTDIPTGEGVGPEAWLATVYVQQDDYCRAVYPLEADLPTLDYVRQLAIKVENCRLDYLVDGTVVGVSGGGLLKNTDGGVWLRDDRTKLKDIARLAYSWYGTARKTLNLAIRGVVVIPDFDLGVLVEEIGTGGTLETINTVITNVSYDLVQGTTRISTQFGEIDFAAGLR